MNKSILHTILFAVCAAAAPHAHAIDFTDQGEYVGSSDCIACHERFFDLWSTSHHGKAMQAFSAAFARTLVPMEVPVDVRGDKFIVELNASGGVLKAFGENDEVTTYPILHSLGGKNVYFFLVPLEQGKLQVAPLAYHVHRKEWYDATSSMVRHFRNGLTDAPVDWTDRQLTFNTACHDCHISQLRKNYDPTTDSYTTTWTEPGINCETCHGPAEAHVKAAEEAMANGVELTDLKLLRFHEDLNMEERDATCAPCHAKMTPLSRDFTPGELFFDHYDLISYEDPDFYPDGRDLGENYTQTGWEANICGPSTTLECIHCHTSSGRFRFKDEPNKSCLPCHQERVDNILEHSHHSAEANVSCVDCHMPMTAQAHMHRSDHTFRPPSPAASLKFGSPNACNLCHHNPEAITGEFHGHREEDMLWAKGYVEKWYGADSGADIIEHGDIILACREGDWEKLPEILAYLASPKCDPAASVAILRLLNNCPYPEKWNAIRAQLNNEHEWIRSAAAASLQYDGSHTTTKALLKAADDEFRTVRIRAASSLLGRPLAAYSDEERAAYKKAHEEYWNSLVIWPDRWSTHYNQGIYHDRVGDADKSLAAYEKAIELRNDVIQPLINASMVHARAGDNNKARAMLKDALKVEPKNAMVNFNLALLEAEMKNTDAAEAHLRTALEADDQMSQAAYNLGVLLAQKKDKEGLQWIEKAALLYPENWNYTSSYLYFLGAEGRQAETESFLARVIDTGRPSAEAYFNLAGLYEQEGRTAEAAETYKKAKLDKRLPMDAKREAGRRETQLRTPPVMKYLLSALLLVVTFSTSAQTNDLHAYLSETRRLQHAGENEQALERHLWFHEHALEHDASMYGVRLSFAMSDWKRLADTYPPALEAMTRIRDEKTQIMVDGQGSHAIFHDIVSLNETLGQDDKTFVLFTTLEEKQPGMAMLCWNLVKDQAFEQQRIDLLKKYASDPAADFQVVKQDYLRLVAMVNSKDMGGTHLSEYGENRFAQQTIQLIQFANTLEKPEVAKAIQKEALEILDDPRIRATLPTAEVPSP